MPIFGVFGLVLTVLRHIKYPLKSGNDDVTLYWLITRINVFAGNFFPFYSLFFVVEVYYICILQLYIDGRC
jgi:hypothetical protein